MKRIALITGANKGIGFETARQLGKNGLKILLGARDTTRGEAAAAQLRRENIDVDFLLIDVTDSASIRAAVERVQREQGRLDILINNAGVLLDDETKKVSEQRMETWHRTFATNLFGLVEVTQAFLPLLRKSERARIVNLSSTLGSIALHSDPASHIYDTKLPAYSVSKAAVNAYTVQLAHELKDTKIKVNAAHPGWVKTDMGGAGAALELEEGAKTSVMLATLPDDGPTGGYFHMNERLPW